MMFDVSDLPPVIGVAPYRLTLTYFPTVTVAELRRGGVVIGTGQAEYYRNQRTSDSRRAIADLRANMRRKP